MPLPHAARTLVQQLEVQAPLFGLAARCAADRASDADLVALRRAAASLDGTSDRDHLHLRSAAVFGMFDQLRDASHNDTVIRLLHVERERSLRNLGSRGAERDLPALRPHYLRLYTGEEIVMAVCDRDGPTAQHLAERVFMTVRAAVLDRAAGPAGG